MFGIVQHPKLKQHRSLFKCKQAERFLPSAVNEKSPHPFFKMALNMVYVWMMSLNCLFNSLSLLTVTVTSLYPCLHSHTLMHLLWTTRMGMYTKWVRSCTAVSVHCRNKWKTVLLVFFLELPLPGGVWCGSDDGLVWSQGDPGGARRLWSSARWRQVSSSEL